MHDAFTVKQKTSSDASLPILSPVHTGDSATVAVFGKSPNSATVAVFGDYSRQCGHGFTRPK